MNRSFFISITFVTILLGVMLGFQFRTTIAGDNVVPRDREQELALEKKNLVENLYKLQMEISDLSTKLEQAGIGQREADEALGRELAKIERFAGLSQVSGPGVELLVQSRPGQAGIDVFDVPKITDEQLLKIVNELYSAGSDAIAINSQRITAISEIRLAGNHINVNGIPLSPPYRIIAIGDASVLKNRLELKGGLVEYLSSQYDILVQIQEKEVVTIPAFTGEFHFDYAKPVKEN
ncbi:MAG: DUF881 domain-containing protein [Desulfotomaculaceae bacterium]|nr:DUF881 domain-containing protein [Desulfotomaculaceae bacterium]